MTFGKNLVALRKKSEKTREQIANDLGIGYPTYANYENDLRTPSLAVLTNFAKYFGVTSDFLLGLSQESLIQGIDEEFLQSVPENHVLNKNARRNWSIIGYTKLTQHNNKSISTTLHISRSSFIKTRLPNLNNLTWEQACIITRSFLATIKKRELDLFSFDLESDGQIFFKVSEEKIYYFNLVPIESN